MEALLEKFMTAESPEEDTTPAKVALENVNFGTCRSEVQALRRAF
jgi:hypothetical protein